MAYSYLGSPYTSSSVSIRNIRYKNTMLAMAILIQREITAYSPIIHFHELTKNHMLPTTYDFWALHNENMLIPAERFIILALKDWEKSIGLRGEYATAKAHKIPVTLAYLRDDGLTITELSGTLVSPAVEEAFGRNPKGS